MKSNRVTMKKCVVLTGAGISADSGLKTFRDAGGLWEGYKVSEVCTPEAFERNPRMVLDFYNMRRRQADAAEPNAAHKALVRLERYYRVQIITQNVDNLHERAGSRRVLHLHGELNKVRSCADESEVSVWTGDLTETDTDSRGGPLRPHIVWFGEEVPLFGQAVEAMRDADIVMDFIPLLRPPEIFRRPLCIHWIHSKHRSRHGRRECLHHRFWVCPLDTVETNKPGV